MTTTTTSTDRVLTYFRSGNTLTDAQARARFGVRNMSALASNLRFKGYAIHNNVYTNDRGNRISAYRLGAPSREVVAAGYRALAA